LLDHPTRLVEVLRDDALGASAYFPTGPRHSSRIPCVIHEHSRKITVGR
jgi:hypothetical protein